MTDTAAPTDAWADDPPPPVDRGRAGGWRTVVGTGIGNALEWYDWSIYAVFTPFFAAQFFPTADPTSSLLAALAVFAVGFLIRPMGGLLFGWLGDRGGRRTAMIASIGAAAGGSLLIGVAPTFATAGVGASVLLLLARLAQGLAHGGEMPAAQTYVAEMAPRGRRGRWSSLIYVSGTTGILFGSLLGAVLSGVLSRPQMLAWGWRIPFVFGGLIGCYALVMRLRLAETPAFQQQRASCPRTPLPRAFWANRTPCLRVILLTVGPTVFYYSWVVAAPTQAISVRGVDPTTALWVGVLANAVFILVLPLFGILSDRVGRKPVLIGSYLGTAVLTFPLSWLLRNEAWQLAVAMIVAMLFTAGTAAIGPAVFAELFPIGLRTAGVGLPYAVGVAACGGTAPYLQTWLATHGLGNLFFGYTVVLLLVGLVVVWRMRETKDVDLASR